MGKNTGIEWASATWNPWMGCTKVSAGCKNCYMFREQKRYGYDPSVIRKSKTKFEDPLKWKEPQRIFVCSWSDFFHKDVDPEWRSEALSIMEEADHHTYMLLTKRPENIRQMVNDRFFMENDHAWVGVSASTQQELDEQLPLLEAVPGNNKFISFEPLVEMVRMGEHFSCWYCGGFGCINCYDGYLPSYKYWIIVGGESGPNARPLHRNWAINLLNESRILDFDFFFKQGSQTATDNPQESWKDFKDPESFPHFLQIREVPEDMTP